MSGLSSTNCKVTTTKGELDMTKATGTVVVDMGVYSLSRVRRHAGLRNGTCGKGSKGGHSKGVRG